MSKINNNTHQQSTQENQGSRLWKKWKSVFAGLGALAVLAGLITALALPFKTVSDLKTELNNQQARQDAQQQRLERLPARLIVLSSAASSLYELKSELQKELKADLRDDAKGAIDSLNKRIDDVSFSINFYSLLITLLLAFGGLIGYFSVKAKAKEEAQEVAKTASKHWFDENEKDLREKVNHLFNMEEKAREAYEVFQKMLNQISAQVTNKYPDTVKTLDDTKKVSEDQASFIKEKAEFIESLLTLKPKEQYTAKDYFSLGVSAYQQQKMAEALVYLDQAEKKLKETQNRTTEEESLLANLMLNKGVTQSQLGNKESAINTYKDLIKDFKESTNEDIKVMVALAMLNMGNIISSQDNKLAIKIYEKLIDDFKDSTNEEIKVVVAMAMLTNGVIQYELGDKESAINTYKDLIKDFKESTNEDIKVQVAIAMFNMGNIISSQDNKAAIEIYNELINKFKDSINEDIKVWVAKSMFNKSLIQDELGDKESAINTYNKLINKFKGSTNEDIKVIVANVMLNKGVAHSLLEQKDEAITILNELLTRFATEQNPALQEPVNKAKMLLERIDNINPPS